MKELPLAIKQAIRRYKAIEVEGLVLYPIRVKEHDNFLMARPVLEALQQSFPVAYMSMPFLQAIYQMDYEAAVNGQEMTGLYTCAILALSLSLRLGEDLSLEERLRQFTTVPDPKNPAKLKHLSVWIEGQGEVKITPTQFTKIREIIAAQNGVKLYGSDANPDLVKAEQEMHAQNAKGLEGTIDDEVDFVAALCHYDEDEIREWSILRLQNRSEALRRTLDYVVCAINEGAGCTWKGGNPTPHPWFTRSTHFGSLVAASDFLNGAGERAIENEGQTTSF